MTEEITITEQHALTPADSLLSMIAAAAKDPSVDVSKMRELWAFKRELEADQAKREFYTALAAASDELPLITKDGKIKLKDGKGEIPFASYENIDAAIRPILSKHGIYLSFKSRKTERGAWIELVVSHRGGHVDTSDMELPPDTGGAKNTVQANGSAQSYARRYLIVNYLNLVPQGADDNGATAASISEEEANNVQNMIDACELPAARVKKLLDYADAESIATIQRGRYEDVMNTLRTEKRLKDEYTASGSQTPYDEWLKARRRKDS